MTKLGVGCHLTKYNNQNLGQLVSCRGGRGKGQGRGDVEGICGTMTTPSSPSPDERQQDHDNDEMIMMRLGVGGVPGSFGWSLGRTRRRRMRSFGQSVVERRLRTTTSNDLLAIQGVNI